MKWCDVPFMSILQMLIDRGVNVEPMARWSGVGLTVFDTKVPLGEWKRFTFNTVLSSNNTRILP